MQYLQTRIGKPRHGKTPIIGNLVSPDDDHGKIAFLDHLLWPDQRRPDVIWGADIEPINPSCVRVLRLYQPPMTWKVIEVKRVNVVTDSLGQFIGINMVTVLSRKYKDEWLHELAMCPEDAEFTQQYFCRFRDLRFVRGDNGPEIYAIHDMPPDITIDRNQHQPFIKIGPLNGHDDLFNNDNFNARVRLMKSYLGM